jgi:hypothetical protein
VNIQTDVQVTEQEWTVTAGFNGGGMHRVDVTGTGTATEILTKLADVLGTTIEIGDNTVINVVNSTTGSRTVTPDEPLVDGDTAVVASEKVENGALDVTITEAPTTVTLLLDGGGSQQVRVEATGRHVPLRAIVDAAVNQLGRTISLDSLQVTVQYNGEFVPAPNLDAEVDAGGFVSASPRVQNGR